MNKLVIASITVVLPDVVSQVTLVPYHRDNLKT